MPISRVEHERDPMSRTAESATTQPIRRRTIAKGMAWSVPAITVAAPVSAAAASGVPPCFEQVDPGLGGWAVGGARYPGCSGSGTPSGHCDARPRFVIRPCDTPVTVRVTNVSGRSRWCWDGKGPVWRQTKSVTAAGGKLTFENVGDSVGTSGSNACTIQAQSGTAVNDGIHVNICPGVVDQIKFEVWYAAPAQATGTPAITGYFTINANCTGTYRLVP